MSESESRILPWPGPMGPPVPGRPPVGGWPRPPSGAWPPGPCPPGPGPFPQPPDIFSAFAWLAKNYQESQAAKAFLRMMIQDLIAEDPTFLANAHATVGVTDGSAAQPGMVGEVVDWGADFAYTDGFSTGPVSLGVLPPGDWNVWGWAGFTTLVTGASFYLNPVPAGFMGNPTAALVGVGGPEIDPESLMLPSLTAVARTSAPTLLAFTANVWTAAGTGPGTMRIGAIARRMR